MFTYEINNNCITITGLKHKEQDQVIYIPEEIDGYPVVTIGDHAFYENRFIEQVFLPNTVQVIENYGFAECRKMTKVTMSNTIKRIGDYAFYNGHSLEEIALPASLETMGYGAFKNCTKLKQLNVYTAPNKPLAIGAMMEDTSHEIRIDLFNEQGQLLTKLIFTEFDYDCILQVEARQFDWVYHGSGNVYRQCISQKGVDFAKYDEIFPSAIREDWPETALSIALGRILYPYALEEKYKEMYIKFLKEHKEDVFNYYMKNGQYDLFERLLPLIADEEIIKQWIESAVSKKATSVVSILMDYNNKNYKKKEKSFQL